MKTKYALVVLFLALAVSDPVAEAAVSKGTNEQLETGGTNQGGGLSTSTNLRQRASIGDAISTIRISSPSFQITPGVLGASLVAASVPVDNLALIAVTAKTSSLGSGITAATWQTDNDPLFLWDPPVAAPELAGYSYAFDATPDEEVNTTDTSYDVAAETPNTLTDGSHTFSVKAVNTLGNAGDPVSFEIWIDTTPPQISTYGPTAGALLGGTPTVTATVSDIHSGVDPDASRILINGSSVSTAFDQATGIFTTSGGSWKEGSNSLELRMEDLLGNAQTPLLWSVTVDTQPPSGTVVINGDAETTTSLYVTLTLSASDVTSGLASLLISNEELTGYAEEPFVGTRGFWPLTAIRGLQKVFVKFKDKAGNLSSPVSDAITLVLLSPETVITSGPAGFTPTQAATFTFMCPEEGCLFSYAFDNEEWSEWSATQTAATSGLAFGNHYFRVKAAKDVNDEAGIQLDEEDPSPAERTWVVGVAPPVFTIPAGPHIKMWRLE